ncbi:cell division control protein 3-like isoform X2 [Scleropages formosus]|nr:cell division control protein 3-like isoform X2 [Scleropages formosus]
MDRKAQDTYIYPASQSLIGVSSILAESKEMKNTMTSSLLFNSVTTAKTNERAASGVYRVSSFKSKFSPNTSSSSSGLESDNESLHSSSSSLDYQASTRMSSHAGSAMQVNEYKTLDCPSLMKFSSHGNMFHSGFEAPLASECIKVNHGSMSSLDQNIYESIDVQSAASLGHRYDNQGFPRNSVPEWQKSSDFGVDVSFSQSPWPSKHKDFTKINKYPFDLDNLDIKPQESPAEVISMPQSISRSNLKKSSLPMTAVSSNLFRKGSTFMQSVQDQGKKQPMFSSGYCPIPDANRNFSAPFSSAQAPYVKLASHQQMADINPVTPLAAAQVNLTFEPEQGTTVKDSVGSIIQKIASFASVDRSRPCKNSSLPVQPQSSLRYFKRETDTQQGLEPQVQMEESEVEKIDEIPCTSNSSLEDHTRDHGFFGYVGIEAVLDQMRHKAMKTGFEFNVMVVGQSGLGKSTLMNTLFKSKVSRKSCTPDYEEKIHKTVHLQSVSHVIEEKGVKMKLTIIDTPGFGDQINNENCWDPIEKYINVQYEEYLKEELSINRKRRIPDTRVHCCVYFLPPSGHWLRPIDVEFMKRLGKIVNIVPVIAKADTLTIEERLEFRDRIKRDLEAYEISVYPQKEYDQDVEDQILNDKIREKIPFAVVGTDKEHQVNGNKILGRKTKWGIIEVENVAHCEFSDLRDLLIRSHLQDLKDITHNIHYETYRVRRLNEIKMNGIGLSPLMLVNSGSEKDDAGNHV